MIYPKKSVKNAEWNGKESAERMSDFILGIIGLCIAMILIEKL